MSTQQINLSKVYVQDEHQRVQATLAKAVDGVPPYSNGTFTKEIDLGFVYVTSTTANQVQQCIKSIILVGGTGATARYYSATVPVSGSVTALVCDCAVTIASNQIVTLCKNGSALLSIPIAASAVKGFQTFPKGKYKFNAGDNFYATVSYAAAVSSTTTASFIKLYVETGS